MDTSSLTLLVHSPHPIFDETRTFWAIDLHTYTTQTHGSLTDIQDAPRVLDLSTLTGSENQGVHHYYKQPPHEGHPTP